MPNMSQAEHEHSSGHFGAGFASFSGGTVALSLTIFTAYGAVQNWKESFYKILVQQLVSNALFLLIYNVFFLLGVACDIQVIVNSAKVFGYVLQYAKFVTLIQKVLLALNRCLAITLPVFYSNRDSKFASLAGMIAWLIPFIPIVRFALKKCEYKYIAYGWYITATASPPETCGISLQLFIWNAQLLVLGVAGLSDVVTLLMLVRYHRARGHTDSTEQEASVEISMALQAVAGGVVLVGETLAYWHMGRVQTITDDSKRPTAWQNYFFASFPMILVPFLDSVIVLIINATIRKWAFSRQRLCCWSTRQSAVIYVMDLGLREEEQ